MKNKNLSNYSFRIRVLTILVLFAFIFSTLTVLLPQEASATTYDLDEAMTPFWVGNTIYNESVLMVSDGTGLPEAELMFEPTAILSVKSTSLDTTYVEGVDWVFQNGKLKLLQNSSAPYMTTSELYPSAPVPGWTQDKVGGGYVLFQEGHYFHDHQLAVTYTYSYSSNSNNQWQGPIPVYNEKELPNTMYKLKNSLPVKIVLYGDSISAGSNGSGYTGASPYLPGWGQLVADKLSQQYGSNITFVNPSVGGKTSSWGASDAHSLVSLQNPDLVIIAFGMNDGSGNVPYSIYRENIQAIITDVKASNPNAEFVLVAPMLANPETLYAGSQDTYKHELEGLAGTDAIVVDMTEVHRQLLEDKKYSDMTGNNVNHPNDFLIRWYAQQVAYRLIESATGTVYYVSSSEGNDSNSGLSPSAPWKTIAKLNSLTFNPGDKILLKSGDTWTGEIFYPKGTGDVKTSRWITVSSYGTGTKPVLSPGADKSDAIWILKSNSMGGWKFTNLDIRDCKTGIEFSADLKSTIPLYPIANGLWVENCNFTNITGHNLGGGANPGHDESLWCSEGIYVSNVNHVTVKSSTFSYLDLPFDIRSCNNVMVDDVTVDHSFRGGMWISENSTDISNNIVIKNSRVYYAGYYGMFWGTCGIQLNGGQNITVQDTEIAYTKAPNCPDGIGLDYEGNVVNGTCLRLYSHDNDGEGFLFMENDSWSEIGRQRNSKILDSVFENNGAVKNTVAFARTFNHNNNNYPIIKGNTIIKSYVGQKLSNFKGTISDSWPAGWMATDNTIIEATPPTFYEDFESIVPTGWTAISGTWKSENGEYSQSDVSPGANQSTITGQTYDNFTAEVKLKLMDPANWAGIQFRKDTISASPFSAGGGYLAYMEPNGRVALFKAGTGDIASANTGLNPANDFVTLKTIASGSNIKVYVNDILYIDTNDIGYSTGYFSLVTYQVHVHFDDLNITSVPVYSDNFNSANTSGWTSIEGIWQAENGEYSQNDTSAGIKQTSITGQPFSNFTAEVKLKLMDASNWAGIQFRKSTPGASAFSSEGGYMVYMEPSGRVALFRAGTGDIASANTGLNPASSYVKLRVIANGNNIKVYANGVLYINITDSTFASGYFSLVAYAAHTHFDDVVISSVPMYSDIFSNGSITGWTTSNGSWQVEDGEYSQHNTSAGAKQSNILGQTFGDFEAEVKVKLVDSSNWAGLQFRKSTIDASPFSVGGGYLVYIEPNGRVALFKAGTGDLASANTSLSPASGFVKISVIAEGSSIKVLVNGIEYIDITDTGYSSGYFSLVAYQTHAHFDNVIIDDI